LRGVFRGVWWRSRVSEYYNLRGVIETAPSPRVMNQGDANGAEEAMREGFHLAKSGGGDSALAAAAAATTTSSTGATTTVMTGAAAPTAIVTNPARPGQSGLDMTTPPRTRDGAGHSPASRGDHEPQQSRGEPSVD
jgi:hypothetical protein